MKVLQLIDSLDAGGAERIAVTFANSLAGEIEASHLCVTRAEGILKDDLASNVSYCFIQKKKTLDLKALFRLKKYVKQHHIDMVHAHTTSYFFATLLKLVYPKIKLVWHTHLGERVTTGRRHNRALYYCSYFFSGIITVNEELSAWCLKYLATKNVHYLPNFVEMGKYDSISTSERGRRIVCLANLKTPKNHENLVQAFALISSEFPEWKLELAGKDFEDSYSVKLKETISNLNLENKVVFLGQQQQVAKLLSGASIGVLSSDSEGLPMALLEYGAAGLAVVVTEVGYCKTVINSLGKLVPPNNPKELSRALEYYILDEEKRKNDGSRFKEHIRTNYSVEGVLPKLLTIYNTLNH